MGVWTLTFSNDMADLSGVYSTKEKAIEAATHHFNELKDYIKDLYKEYEESWGCRWVLIFVDPDERIRPSVEVATIQKFIVDEIA